MRMRGKDQLILILCLSFNLSFCWCSHVDDFGIIHSGSGWSSLVITKQSTSYHLLCLQRACVCVHVWLLCLVFTKAARPGNRYLFTSYHHWHFTYHSKCWVLRWHSEAAAYVPVKALSDFGRLVSRCWTGNLGHERILILFPHYGTVWGFLYKVLRTVPEQLSVGERTRQARSPEWPSLRCGPYSGALPMTPECMMTQRLYVMRCSIGRQCRSLVWWRGPRPTTKCTAAWLDQLGLT